MFTGAVSRRVSITVERVVAAMLIQKMKSLAIALVVGGVVVATAVGLFRGSVSEGADPEAPPKARLTTAEPRQPAGEVREFMVIPLRKLDAETTARVIVETFKGKGVTVAAVAGEEKLLLHASAKMTGDVQELLVKLGEETVRPKAAIVRLKNVNCTDAARTIQEVFDGPKPARRSSRVTIAAIPDDNALVVFASPIDILTVRELLAKYIDAPAPAAKPEQPREKDEKRFSMRFQNLSWDDVLDWYGKTSGLMPILTVKPKGQFSFMPPRLDQKYTLAEITDILNEALTQQKLILIRRQVSFITHPSDEKIDASEVPRLELNELSSRGKTELVQVLFPLKSLTVEDTAPEIQRLLSPFGTVSSLSKANTLVVLDTAGNVSRIHNMIQDIEGSYSSTLVCKHKKALEVADHLKTLLATLEIEKAVTFAVDEKANSIKVTGPPEKVVLVKQMVAELDKLKKPPEPDLRKYSVPAGKANAIAKTLMADYPKLPIIAVPSANEIWIVATPEEHVELKKKLGGPKSSN